VALADRLTRDAGVTRLAGAEPGVELVRRGRHLFVLNRSHDPVKLPARGLDLLTGERVGGTVDVPAEGAAVVREEET
jgi:beta-galactosidase